MSAAKAWKPTRVQQRALRDIRDFGGRVLVTTQHPHRRRALVGGCRSVALPSVDAFVRRRMLVEVVDPTLRATEARYALTDDGRRLADELRAAERRS